MNTSVPNPHRRTLLVSEAQLEFIKLAAKRRQVLLKHLDLTREEVQYSTSEMIKDLLLQVAYAKRGQE